MKKLLEDIWPCVVCYVMEKSTINHRLLTDTWKPKGKNKEPPQICFHRLKLVYRIRQYDECQPSHWHHLQVKLAELSVFGLLSGTPWRVVLQLNPNHLLCWKARSELGILQTSCISMCICLLNLCSANNSCVKISLISNKVAGFVSVRRLVHLFPGWFLICSVDGKQQSRHTFTMFSSKLDHHHDNIFEHPRENRS